MPKLRNVRHEQFCQHIAHGLNASEAYRQASGRSKNANVHSDEWMNARGVQERIAELRRENDRKCTLSREAALQFLSEVVNTPIGSVTKDSRLAQAMKDTDDVHEIRMPDKLVAVQTLGKMCDWFGPEKFQVSGDTLSAYLVALRAKPIFELERPALPLENGGNGEESRG
jgi:hypothetical protein